MPGGGRPTKAKELGLAKMLEDCVSLDEEKEIWEAIKREAKGGSIPHAQVYLNYKYGKPREIIEQKTDGQIAIRIIRNDGDNAETPKTT